MWTLDKAGNVKIIRHGFLIAPDFGGTAHAYGGATMTATSGDVLPWHKKPTLEDMLRGYIIKSRVKQADKIILAQPYSPHLFRQGLLPGPKLLLDVLLKKVSLGEVKKQWSTIEKDSKKKNSSKKYEVSNIELTSGIF